MRVTKPAGCMLQLIGAVLLFIGGVWLLNGGTLGGGFLLVLAIALLIMGRQTGEPSK